MRAVKLVMMGRVSRHLVLNRRKRCVLQPEDPRASPNHMSEGEATESSSRDLEARYLPGTKEGRE